jgi:D-glycero-D-manno-heptose 1,7-bisphosphate phosphatase
MSARALFLDRDGVINLDTAYAHLSEQITFIDGIFDLARAAREKNYLLIVITNQAGIGRGYYTQEQFHELMQWMGERFEKEGAKWTAYYFCPHHPDEGCPCRKPKPGMLTQAAKEWGVDMENSIMVGDNETDMRAAEAAGVGKRVLIESAEQLRGVIALL